MSPSHRWITVPALALWFAAPVFGAVHANTGGPAQPAKAAICASCHGTDGNSPGTLQPNLAGQNREYLVRQLQAFKNESRRNSTMNAIAGGLSDAEIESLADYFAAQKPAAAGGATTLARKGRALFKPCGHCHGASAAGHDGYPRLAGQHPEYLVRQLENFKKGLRTNPAMQGVVERLSPADMKALAAYLGSLGAPK